MNTSISKGNSSVRILRWTARLLSIISIGIILLFAIGEGFNPIKFTTQELVLGLFFPLGVCFGMITAWKWEGLGGVITISSLLLFYLVQKNTSTGFPSGPAFIVFAFPGFLFLLLWFWRIKGFKNY